MNNRKPFNKLFNNVLSSAKPPEEKGLGVRVEGKGRTEAREVSLTPQIIEDIFNEQDGKCALSGADLDLDALYIPNSPLAPSIDRISNNYGYHRDNVHIVLRFVNMGRGRSEVNEAVAAINSIKAADYEIGPWYFPPIPYDELFYKPIANSLEAAQLGLINILQAPMGAGKTYTAFMHLIPELITKKDVDVIWFFAPNCDNIPKDEFNDYLDEWYGDERFEGMNLRKIKIIKVGGLNARPWREAKKKIRDGYTTIFISTDATIGKVLLEKDTYDPTEDYKYLKSLWQRFALLRDEIHYGSVSDKKLLKKVMGGSENEKYKARMYNVMSEFTEVTPWVFGFSATPTSEQIEEEVGTSKYQIINGWVSPKDCIANSAWIGNIYQTLDLKKYCDDNYMMKSLRRLMSRVESRSLIMDKMVESNSKDFPILNKLITKTTGMIKVDVGSDKEHKACLYRVKKLLVKAGIPSDWTFIETTADGWVEYNSKGRVEQKNTGLGWLSEINDPNSSARLLVVVNKGDKGINVPTLTDGLIFRKPTPRDKELGIWIVRNPLQLLGRWVRKNWGGLSLEEINSLSREISYQIFSQLNTFDIEVPDTPQWKQTIEEFTHPVNGYAVSAIDILGYEFQWQRKKTA